VQSVSTLSPYKLVSQVLAISRLQKLSVLPFHSKMMGFDTYDHLVSETVSSPTLLIAIVVEELGVWIDLSRYSTPGTVGCQLQPKILDMIGSIQRQMAREP
jgi:hypothetical protein